MVRPCNSFVNASVRVLPVSVTTGCHGILSQHLRRPPPLTIPTLTGHQPLRTLPRVHSSTLYTPTITLKHAQAMLSF